MSASQPAYFNLQEFSDIGAPLVGGRLYTYTQGTTAFKTAYTDAAGAIPQTYTADGLGGQYIALDARGELPAPVYLTAGSYDIALKRADGSTVWTRRADPIADAVTPFAAALAAYQALVASTGGASVVGYLAAAGLYPQTLEEILQEEVDLMSFIPEAERAAIIAKTSAYDAADRIIAAITFVNLLPSGTRLVAPRGKFVCSKSIPWKNNVTLVGKTKMATVFEFTHTGHGFVSSNTINSTTAANIGLSQCTVTCTNFATSTGAAFVDVAGSYVDLDDVKITGFKFGVIFDQSEHANIDRCEIITPSGGTGLWLVNGPDFTPGVLPNYTNKIAITRTQFNAAAGALYNILDDGGGSHAIRDCNFNAGVCGIRVAGVFGLEIRSNEMEVHTSEDIYLADTTASGTFVGPCTGFEIATNIAISSNGGRNVAIQNASNGTIHGNCFGQAVACMNFLNGAANQSTGIIIEGNYKLITGVGAPTTGAFISGSSRSLRQNIIRQTAVTQSALGAAAGSVVITPRTMEFIGIGTRLHLNNVDGTNGEDVVVTATTATTFTATLATTKNALFLIYGATPQDQEQGIWPTAPALGATTTNGTHTGSFVGEFSRRGNEVTINGILTITAKDAAIAGNLRILNLPYAAIAVPNAPFLVNISLFDGFTLAGGYQVLSGLISPSGTTIDLRKCASGQPIALVPATDLPGATVTIVFSGSYLTSAL